MSKEEFIQLMTGKPWRNRSLSFDAVDCWGLVALYYSNVLGSEINHTKKYMDNGEFSACFFDEVVYWRKTDHRSDGCIFVAYIGSFPAHVGLVINGEAYHARAESSHVRFDRIRTIEKLFTKVEYYEYANN